MMVINNHEFPIHPKEISNTEQHTPAAVGDPPPDCWSVVTQPTCITTDLEIYYLLHYYWHFMFEVVRISSDEARMSEPSAVCSHR